MRAGVARLVCTQLATNPEQEARNDWRHDGPEVRTGVQAADGLDVPLCRRVAGVVARFLGGNVPRAHQDVPRHLCTADLARDRPGADIPGELGPPADRSVAGLRPAGAGERRVRCRAATDLLDGTRSE